MNRITFFFVILLSLVFVGLNVLETWMDQTWEMTLVDQKAIQIHLVNAQRIHLGAQQLLRRLAVDSQHDPAILELLKKNKINVTMPVPGDNPGLPGQNTPPAVQNQPPSHP